MSGPFTPSPRSFGRRPFGKPALSPARTPRRSSWPNALGAMAVLRRRISEGRTFACLLSPSMPVRKVATRSWRSPLGMLGSTPWSWLARIGSVTSGMAPSVDPVSGALSVGKTSASWRGSSVLNTSFALRGTTTSLTSGLPRRETCTQRPVLIGLEPLFSSNTRTFWRSEVVQMPMTSSPSPGSPSAGLPPSTVVGRRRLRLPS